MVNVLKFFFWYLYIRKMKFSWKNKKSIHSVKPAEDLVYKYRTKKITFSDIFTDFYCLKSKDKVNKCTLNKINFEK